MNYNPRCENCKHFVKTEKSFIKKKYKLSNLSKFLDGVMNPDVGHCRLNYCIKVKKKVYRKNMR